MDMKSTNQKVIRQFRAGSPMRMPRDRMLLLTTTGRHTGREHVTPMMFAIVDETLTVAASNSGAERHPDWYLNLVDNPRVTVERGDRRYPADARTVPPERRDAVWQAVVAQIPLYTRHQAATARQIPLIELVPVETGA